MIDQFDFPNPNDDWFFNDDYELEDEEQEDEDDV